MVTPNYMTNIINILGQDILKYLVKNYFFDNFSGGHEMTIEVMVGYDLWSIRTTNGSYDS